MNNDKKQLIVSAYLSVIMSIIIIVLGLKQLDTIILVSLWNFLIFYGVIIDILSKTKDKNKIFYFYSDFPVCSPFFMIKSYFLENDKTIFNIRKWYSYKNQIYLLDIFLYVLNFLVIFTYSYVIKPIVIVPFMVLYYLVHLITLVPVLILFIIIAPFEYFKIIIKIINQDKVLSFLDKFKKINKKFMIKNDSASKILDEIDKSK